MLSRMLSCGGGRQDMSTSTRCVTMQHVVVQNYRMQTAWLPNPRFEKGWTRSMFRKKNKNKCSSLSTFPSAFQKLRKGLLNVNFMRSALHCQAIHFLGIMGRFIRFQAWKCRLPSVVKLRASRSFKISRLCSPKPPCTPLIRLGSGVKQLLFDFQDFFIKRVGTTFANSYIK